MLRSSQVAFTLAALTSTALASDLPFRDAPVSAIATPTPFFTWTGFYFGLNAGDAFSARNSLSGSAPGFGSYLGGHDDYHLSTSSGGFSGGGQIGYNYQFGVGSGIVAGIEGDFAYTDLAGSRALPATGELAGLTSAYRTSIDGIGTIRGRLGYGLGPLLVYGTGGFAYDVADRQSLVATPSGVELLRLDLRNVDIGYATGGGVELALPVGVLPGGMGGPGSNAAVTIRAEYLHVATGEHAVPLTVAGQAVTLHTRDGVDLGRAGINYKF